MDVSKMKTPGERIKYIREELLKLSRADVCKRYAISVDTLAAWENEKIQISEKGIERCIKFFNAENLIVSREWILIGAGLSPNFSFELGRYFKTQSTKKPDQQIDDSFLLAQEIDYFRSLTSNSITALISTEDMMPVYSRGDYVGGRFRYGKDIEECVGKNCIVKTKDGAMFIRRIAKSQTQKKYNLVCLNPNWSGNPEPVLFNIKIECAAPIIWHRKHDE